MAAHARLKNEFTEDEKYYNLMWWLNDVKESATGKELFPWLSACAVLFLIPSMVYVFHFHLVSWAGVIAFSFTFFVVETSLFEKRRTLRWRFIAY